MGFHNPKSEKPITNQNKIEKQIINPMHPVVGVWSGERVIVDVRSGECIGVCVGGGSADSDFIKAYMILARRWTLTLTGLFGGKLEWPELVGAKVDVATAIIERENTKVKASTGFRTAAATASGSMTLPTAPSVNFMMMV
ncbi:hypothetical protein QJS10_CPB21g01447 [Acorus calamus]|uniref:Uncharacterized protein n=1 Tax=Acorus calamus TaxID=4465 RepID=A0AAV9C5Q9_ACOCL|nr:hypothetical protein QJS10_CPB21g01447 [Acorus calamus]